MAYRDLLKECREDKLNRRTPIQKPKRGAFSCKAGAPGYLSTRTDRAHKSSAIAFCSALSAGHPERLTCVGCGFGSGSISSLASKTAPASKSARASAGLFRDEPTKSPIDQISSSDNSSLHIAEIFRSEGLGRKAPGFGAAGSFFL
jgi:hypothetical protein